MSSSAKRALKVLELVASGGRPMGVTEIARLLDASAGTVFRTLDALQKSSYADRYLHSSRYVLGPASSRLRHSLFAGFKIREAALPFLRQAASSMGETASLIVPLGWYGVRIASARGSNEVTNAPALGVVGPLGGHYASRAILAHFSTARQDAYFEWVRTEEKIPLPLRERGKAADQWPRLGVTRAEIAAVARNGFANEEKALALPIRSEGEAIASLAIEGPIYHGAARGRDAVVQCREIVREIEAIVAARPVLFTNPFAHIDPATIAFGERSSRTEKTTPVARMVEQQ
jgi:DNA-binding IclR family transcriptional regulator